MQYTKALVAVLAAVASAIVAALTGDQHVSAVEWINIAIAAATALNVFVAPNVTGAPVTKAVVAAVMAALTLAVNVVADGVTISEWLQLLVAAAGTVAVYGARNNPPAVVTP